MRRTFSHAYLPVIMASFLIASPVLANTAPAILFVPGTGAVAAGTAYDAAMLPSFAGSAAPQRDAEAEMTAMGETLSNPGMQDGVANMVEKLTARIMRLPVGKFANAIEKARPGTIQRRIRDRDTIADMTGKDMRDMPEMLGKQSRVAMRMMGGLTKAFASMMPEFEKMGREMEADMADLKVKRR